MAHSPCHPDRSPPQVDEAEGSGHSLCHFERSAAESRNLANDLNEPTRIHASSHLLLHAFSFSVIFAFCSLRRLSVLGTPYGEAYVRLSEAYVSISIFDFPTASTHLRIHSSTNL